AGGGVRSRRTLLDPDAGAAPAPRPARIRPAPRRLGRARPRGIARRCCATRRASACSTAAHEVRTGCAKTSASLRARPADPLERRAPDAASRHLGDELRHSQMSPSSPSWRLVMSRVALPLLLLTLAWVPWTASAEPAWDDSHMRSNF